MKMNGFTMSYQLSAIFVISAGLRRGYTIFEI
jgi:hypothetical protein